jgi:hypothetical protein
MLAGAFTIVDGAHRPPPTSLAMLSEVVHDRQCALPGVAHVLRDTV